MLFVLLLFPCSGYAAEVSGVVLDPDDRAVRDAHVNLVCPDWSETVHADARGRFKVAAPPHDACILTITHPGFAPLRQLVEGPRPFLVARLQLAPVSENVNVVAEPAASWPRIGSVSLSSAGGDFHEFAATTPELIRYAELLAGTAARRASIYVDGLPGGVLPALNDIAQISIDADPFSAERADGDVVSIDILTKAPSRTPRFFLGGDLPGVAAHDMLAPAAPTKSRFGTLGVQGPVPRLPVTFSATAALGRTSQGMPIHAVLPGIDTADRPVAAGRNGSGSVGLYYVASPSLRARFSFRESRAASSNAGVGGLALREAGFRSSFLTRESRVTATGLWERVLYEGGVVVRTADSSTRANSLEPGVTVGGAVVMGGAAISDGRRSTSRWTSRHVIRSRGPRPWTAGVVADGAAEMNRQTPNSAGSFYFSGVNEYQAALAGGETGTWLVARGERTVRFGTLAAAPFVQTELVRARAVTLGAGVRADYQSGFNTLLSPRASLASRWRQVNVRTGAGLFVQSVPASIFISALENDGEFLQQFVASHVSLTAPAESRSSRASSIHARVAADLTRPRTWLWRVSVDRPAAWLSPALEYSVAADRHLLGSDRRPDASGWADVLQSNRRAIRHTVLGQVRQAWRRQQVVVNYEFTHARDNTDGPFSFLTQPGNIGSEWARSAGVSPHAVTVMGIVSLPAAISLNLVQSWRSSMPFNITTAIDAAGNGLAVDRGGRARNSGDGPPYSLLALYGHRRVGLPSPFKTRRLPAVNVGVRADNILNNRNDLVIGSIVGSTTFGRPLAAYPGRSLRILLGID